MIVINNKTGVSLYKTAAQAFESVLPLKAIENENPVQSVPITIQEMKEYVGVYQNGLFRIELVEKDGQLFSKFGNNLIPVTKIGEREFNASVPGINQPQRFYLVPGKDGRIQYLHSQGRALKKKSGLSFWLDFLINII